MTIDQSPDAVKLRRYAFLTGYAVRTDEEEKEVHELKDYFVNVLKDDPGWDIVPRQPMKPSTQDISRIKRGDISLRLSSSVIISVCSDQELSELLHILSTGITSLQSTDDLGSPELNKSVLNKEALLRVRYDNIIAEQVRRKSRK